MKDDLSSILHWPKKCFESLRRCCADSPTDVTDGFIGLQTNQESANGSPETQDQEYLGPNSKDRLSDNTAKLISLLTDEKSWNKDKSLKDQGLAKELNVKVHFGT